VATKAAGGPVDLHREESSLEKLAHSTSREIDPVDVQLQLEMEAVSRTLILGVLRRPDRDMPPVARVVQRTKP
jgi:hypothetical protein